MKLQTNKKATAQAFTLIEMIGVLAVIGILAALLVPKIFEAINNARINSTAVSIASVKTSIADHYAKAGALQNTVAGGVLPFSTVTYDDTLLTEGFLDKKLAVKIATPVNTSVILTNCAATAAVPVADDSAFDLGGSGANTALGSALVAVKMTGVLETDAKALNDLIDGAALGSAIGTTDIKGRVKYTTPTAGGLVDVMVYLTHR